MLSHDLFEGLYARCALVSDVELVDDYPSSVLAHARRQHRWVRGDWQILRGCCRWCRRDSGLERSRLPLISRWKILDNLRRSLVAPALLALLVLGLDVAARRSPLAWTLAALAVLGFPLLPPLVAPGAAARGRSSRSACSSHDVGAELKTAGAQVLLADTLLAYHAGEMLHAIVLTLVRMVITQRRLLEWETAATTAARSTGSVGATRPGPFLDRDVGRAGGRPCVLLGAVLSLRPDALPVALPFLVAWLVSPLVAWWLSRPVVPPRLRARRRRTRSSCAASRGAPGTTSSTSSPREDHWLPPDNVQAAPEQRVAHRTSPTNIGMGLLSTLAAHDLGYLTTAAARRPQSTRTLHDRRGRSSSTRATCSTGTTPPASRRCRRATSRRSTAATWPAR